KDKNINVEFLGRRSFAEISNYLARCAFTIVPSEWYDNFPNTVLESFAFKKCVVATDTGSLRELVVSNETGFLFRLKDARDLADKIACLFNDMGLCRNLGENAFSRLNSEYSAEKHYDTLINLFAATIAKYN